MDNSIIFFGDVFLDKVYDIKIDNLKNFVFNLEYSIIQEGTPYPNKINLFSPENYIKKTFGENPIAVCLSNNHIFDYGIEGFINTINILDKEKISYFGAGKKDENYNNPCIINLNDKSIALFGYTCMSTNPVIEIDQYGVAIINLKMIEKDIKMYRDYMDVIIINFHWGIEGVGLPKPEDIIIAKKTIDLGADAIIGHHAHSVQAIDIYNNCVIAYGLGNCIFPNINLKAYYNEDRKSKRIFISKRWFADRASIGLEVSLDDFTFDKKYLWFNYNNKLIEKKTVFHRFGDFSTFNILHYQKKFHKHIMYRRRVGMFKQLITSPKIPSWNNIKKVIYK